MIKFIASSFCLAIFVIGIMAFVIVLDLWLHT